MPDILIRGLSKEAIEEFTSEAEKLGLSRNEYVKRRLLRELRADVVYAEHRVAPRWSWDDLRELTDDFSHEEIEEMVGGKGPYMDH